MTIICKQLSACFIYWSTKDKINNYVIAIQALILFSMEMNQSFSLGSD